MWNSSNCQEPARSRLEEARVVGRHVRGEDLAQAVAALALVRHAHVLAEVVVVLHHVELPDRGPGRGRRHPRPLPGPLHVDLLLDCAGAGQAHGARQHVPQPGRLEAVGQDIVEGGDLAPDEGEVRHAGGDHVPVEVQPVLLDVQHRLDDRRVEEVVGLLEARGVDDHVRLEFGAVRKHHATLLEAGDGAVLVAHLAPPEHVAELVGQDLAAAEQVLLDGALRHLVPGQAEL
mmetsp:Transcript_13416/g.38131  ORF Transcript_13416/g.38131 Transcript_13416/m.38131 type:complete len:232 (+) Transcript_13416:102-797(+)